MVDVESNIRARVNALTDMASGEVGVVRGFTSDIMALRPVTGVVNLVTGTVDVVGKGIVRQADITRNWLGGRL